MRRRLAFATLALGFAAAWGCAKKEPPSGGPPDLTPPRLVRSEPDSGRAGVPLATRIALTFSEPMEPRSTQEAVQVAPAVDIRARRWSGHTLILVLDQKLRADQTYTVFVGSAARDRHGNNMTAGASVVFTTGATFRRGRIEGTVTAKGFAAPGTYLWCYDASRTGVPDSTARDFDALGLVDVDGKFRVDGLRTPGRYKLWAFADLNANRSFEPDRDILAPVDTVVALTDSMPVAGPVHLTLVDPRAPASVHGTVIDSLGVATSEGVTRVLAVADRDSTLRALSDVDRDGHFDLSLRAGPWTIRAFRDLDRNRDWEPSREPASAPAHVTVEPAGDVPDVNLVLRRGGP